MRYAGFIDRDFEQIAVAATECDERIIPIDLAKLAIATWKLCPDQDREIVAVGASALDITGYWEQPVLEQPVCTLSDTRNREEREIQASTLAFNARGRYFVDDVAVSGLTLQAARAAAGSCLQDEVAVGMAWKSRRLNRRVGVPLRAAVTYAQEGGGTPAINTLATFIKKPELARNYAERRFDDTAAFEQVLALYQEGAAK